MTAVRRADAWLFGAETGERARTVEVGLAVLLALRLALSPFRDLAGLPAGLYRPPWFLTGLHTIPSSGTILVLQIVGVVAALIVLGPPGTTRRVGFAVAWVCLVLLAGFRDSRGKIMHNDVLLIWSCVPFLFAAADLRFRDRTPSSRAGWPVRVSMTFVAFAYFFAGVAKLRRSGPAWVFSDNTQWVLRWGADVSARAYWPDFTRWVADQPALALGSAAVTLGLELTFPVVLFSARLRPFYAWGAVILHVATAALLGYDYWLWAAVDLVVLVDWSRLLRRVAP